MLIRLIVVVVLCTYHGALKVNADEIPEAIQDQLQAAEEVNNDDKEDEQAPPQNGPAVTQAPSPDGDPDSPKEAGAPPPPTDGDSDSSKDQGAPPTPSEETNPPPTGGAPTAPGDPSPPGVPNSTETPAPPTNPEEASLEVPKKTFDANKTNDWTFTLTLKIKPETPDDVHFLEGEENVKIGESSKSFSFVEGKLENGMLLVPVQVKEHEEQEIKFKVEFKGKTEEITVNVAAEEKPAFELLEKNYTASEGGNWTFIIKLKADKMLNYKFTEGGESAGAGEDTKCLKFGDITQKEEDSTEYDVPVEVIDLSPNEITFSISAAETTEEAVVKIEPPSKPMLLKNEFEVSKASNFTFELQIKSKPPPPDVKFTEGNATVEPGKDTASFHFGQLTNDITNLYSVEVKTISDIDKPKQFEVSINGEEATVEVSKKSGSSAMSTGPLTLSCLFIPVLLMLFR